MDAGRTRETLGSETKDSLFLPAIARVPSLVPDPQASSPPVWHQEDKMIPAYEVRCTKGQETSA